MLGWARSERMAISCRKLWIASWSARDAVLSSLTATLYATAIRRMTIEIHREDGGAYLRPPRRLEDITISTIADFGLQVDLLSEGLPGTEVEATSGELERLHGQVERLASPYARVSSPQ